MTHPFDFTPIYQVLALTIPALGLAAVIWRNGKADSGQIQRIMALLEHLVGVTEKTDAKVESLTRSTSELAVANAQLRVEVDEIKHRLASVERRCDDRRHPVKTGGTD